MPRIAPWDNLPPNVRQHLIDRMRDRAISLADLNQLRLWIENRPAVPEGDWYKDFGSFKICGHGSYPKTFLLPGPSSQGRSAMILTSPWRATHTPAGVPQPSVEPAPTRSGRLRVLTFLSFAPNFLT